MSYDLIALIYYKNNRKQKLVLHKYNADDFQSFCHLLVSGQFVPGGDKRKIVLQNIDNLKMWLDSQFCGLDMFLSNLVDDMFYHQGEIAKRFFAMLQQPTTTQKDFAQLEII